MSYCRPTQTSSWGARPATGSITTKDTDSSEASQSAQNVQAPVEPLHMFR